MKDSAMKKKSITEKLKGLRNYADGKVNSVYEFFMLIVIIVNTVSLGLETSRSISLNFRNTLILIDQICLYLFIADLIFKAIVYNKDFFGEEEKDGCFSLNKWNISDLIIVVISVAASLPYFTIFRTFKIFRSVKVIKSIKSFNAVRGFKLVNESEELRSTFKGLVRAIPGILWTFCFLALFTYVYAIVGTNVFGDDFSEFFGSLDYSFLSLCQIITFDSWISQIARPIIQVYPLAWLYFISFAFIAASVVMNVIVGIIVDSMERERERQRYKKENIEAITLEKLSKQIQELEKKVEKSSKV